MVKRIKILDVPVDVLDFDTAVKWVKRAVELPGNKRIVAVNPEKVIRARRERDFLKFLEDSDLLIPDGIGVVKAARLLGLASMERVPGSDLMPAICKLAAENDLKVFFYGSKPDVNEKARIILKKRYPNLQIAGWSHGYIPDDKMEQLIPEINDSGADILFVALGSPKQEKWLAEYDTKLKVKLCQGIGGTLDTIAGRVKRAPEQFQKLNLEWFYRLLKQPSRARRQIVLLQFIWLVLLERVSIRHCI